MNTAALFVDYEGVLVDLSHSHQLQLNSLLIDHIAVLQQIYDLRVSYLIADSMCISDLNALEENGYSVWSAPVHSPDTIGYQVERATLHIIDSYPDVDTFILLGGDLDYISILQILSHSQKQAVVQTIRPLKSVLPSGFANHVLIPVPPQNFSKIWSRRVMLDAIVLIAYYSSDVQQKIIDSNDFISEYGLGQFEAHRGHEMEWTLVAIREGILRFTQNESDQTFMLHLNMLHSRVRNCQRQLIRTVMLIDTMQRDKDWVSFGALERTLKTGLQTMRREQRQDWIELLVEAGVLLKRQQTTENANYSTTIIGLNPDHPAASQRNVIADFELLQLINVVQQFLLRNKYRWMAISSLLKRLTRLTTRFEAREQLRHAGEEGILELVSIPSKSNPARRVSAVRLNENHPLVQDALDARDMVLKSISNATNTPYIGISPETILDVIKDSLKITQELSLAWYDMLLGEELLVVATGLADEFDIQAYVLPPDDAVVKHAIS